MSPLGRLRRAATGERRLAGFYAFVVALETAFMFGPRHGSQDGYHYWIIHLALPMAITFGFISLTLAAVALAFRWARGAAAGSARDPVIRLRDFFRRHRRFAALLPWAPLLVRVPDLLEAIVDELHHRDASSLTWLLSRPAALLAVGAAAAFAGRFALRSLDMIRDREAETVTAIDRDETTFQAVAVTARTQGAVAGMLALTIAVINGVAQSGRFWMYDYAGGLPLVGYAVAALGFAAWFRKASTIAVGRDGIFIRGTSKERFFAYQDFDEVRLAGMHFDFHRAGKRVLRLQLHGTDDARAEALAERIRAALAQSHRADGAHLLARAAVSGSLGRAAQGAADYRQPAVSREQLWELVEGEATDRTARLAAAEALATSIEGHDRARLRIAANHVADPRVRVTLEELADEDDTSEAPLAHAAPAARLG